MTKVRRELVVLFLQICICVRGYLEVWQEAAVSLVTSVSLGREAVRHRHSSCPGDGSLWESHTLHHYSDTCGAF